MSAVNKKRKEIQVEVDSKKPKSTNTETPEIKQTPVSNVDYTGSTLSLQCHSFFTNTKLKSKLPSVSIPLSSNTTTRISSGILSSFARVTTNGWVWYDCFDNRTEYNGSPLRFIHLPPDLEKTFTLTEHLAALVTSLHNYYSHALSTKPPMPENKLHTLQQLNSNHKMVYTVKIKIDENLKDLIPMLNPLNRYDRHDTSEILNLFWYRRLLQQNNCVVINFVFDFYPTTDLYEFHEMVDQHLIAFEQQEALAKKKRESQGENENYSFYGINYLQKWTTRLLHCPQSNLYSQFGKSLYPENPLNGDISIRAVVETNNNSNNSTNSTKRSKKNQTILPINAVSVKLLMGIKPSTNDNNDNNFYIPKTITRLISPVVKNVTNVNTMQHIMILEYLQVIGKLVVESRPVTSIHPVHSLTISTNSNENERILKDLVDLVSFKNTDLLNKAIQMKNLNERLYRLELWKFRDLFDYHNMNAYGMVNQKTALLTNIKNKKYRNQKQQIVQEEKSVKRCC